ncbi:hypothetical protein [Plantibacter sp. ME-Dv--P-095]|uniref:hypothetical protein n=1 Tax=Plantibacter sp. ME-Dv--P-095 TaxID=3040299 RepID=UPI00254DFEB5|nr:hypothetical protein [Plantibacter sp. ME-Dv--P-095]
MFVRVETQQVLGGGTYWAQSYINVEQITRIVRRPQSEKDQAVTADVSTADGATVVVKLGDVAKVSEPDVQTAMATLTTGGSLVK